MNKMLHFLQTQHQWPYRRAVRVSFAAARQLAEGRPPELVFDELFPEIEFETPLKGVEFLYPLLELTHDQGRGTDVSS